MNVQERRRKDAAWKDTRGTATPARGLHDTTTPARKGQPASFILHPSSLISQPSFVTSAAAGLCWTGVLSLLLRGNLHLEVDLLAPQRLLFYTLTLAAGLLTFVPIQHAQGLPRLALEGVVSTFVLIYTLAFVPPPTKWLFSLPEIPVYVLFIAALFWCTTAIFLPFIYAAGQRIFHQRARRMDVRRARRQAYEVGIFVSCIAVLAALQVLTWVSLLLLLLILFTAELLFLSRIEVQTR